MSHAPERLFAHPRTAMFAVMIALLCLSTGYILVHAFRDIPSTRPWDNAVIVQDDFRIDYREHLLKKYFEAARVLDLKNSLDRDAERFQKESLEWRRTQLRCVQQFCERYGIQTPLTSFQDGEAPSILFDNSPGAILKRAVKWPDVTREPVELEEKRRKLVDTTPLKQVRKSLAELENKVDDRYWKTLITFIRGLDHQIRKDAERRQLLRDRISALEPVLAFRWLQHDDGIGWIFEVIAWTLVGVLANTMIVLFQTARANRYNPSEFVLVLPKAILAPFLSIVVIAIWAAGISDAGITILNLPYLLALSFFLGFGTESLYGKLRGMMTTVLGSVTKISPTRLAAMKQPNLSDIIRAQRVSPSSLPPATTLRNLAKDLENVLKGEVRTALAPGFIKRAPTTEDD